MENSLKKTRIEIILLFLLYIFILPRVSMALDMGYWLEWALNIHKHGLSHAYDTSINYFPLYLYGLFIYDLLQGSDANIIANIYCIKILMVCFDFLPVVVLSCFRQKIFSYKIPYLYLLLNIAYVFNAMVWGQIDGMFTNLAFLAIITGLIYPSLGVLLYVLALNTKPQAIVFLPIISFVLLYSIKNIKTLFYVIMSAAITQFLLIIPFINTGGVGILWFHATHAVDLYNKLSISAFNIWYLIARGNMFFINDKDTYVLFSYKTIGLLLFTISALFVLVPLLRYIYNQKIKSSLPDTNMYKLLFLSTGLLCLFFFYFNSQMHERYAHPIIIFFFFYAVVSGNYKLYILASIPYFLSLDKCFSYPDGYLPIVHYKLIYASVIIALLYSATVIYGSYLYYNLVKSLKK